MNDAIDVEGDFALTNGTVNCNGKDQNVAGNFTIDVGTTYVKGGVLTFDGSTIFTDNASQNIGTVVIGLSPDDVTLASNLIADYITINDTDSFTTDGYDIDLTWNMTINGAGILDATSGTGGTTSINMGGNWNNNISGIFTAGNSTVNFDFNNPSGVQAITSGGTGAGKAFYNLIASGTSDISIVGDLEATGDLTNSSGDFRTNNYDLIVGGNLENAGTLDTTASEDIYVGGSWTNTGTFDAATGTVTFNGTGTQDLVSGGDGFYNLTHSGTGDLRINDDLAVTGDLVNSAGKMDTNDTFNNITVTGDVTVSGGELEIDPIATLITGGTLTVSGGTLDAVSGVLDANGDVIISSGTLIAPTGNFNVAGDFTIGASGTYTKGGLLIFDGTTIFTDGATQNVGDVFVASSVTLASKITLDSLAVQDGDNDGDVVLLLDLDSDFTDSSVGATEAHPATEAGTIISAAQSEFGGASGYFDGSSYIKYTDSDDWYFGTEDFTIDFWFNTNKDLSSTQENLIVDGDNANHSFKIALWTGGRINVTSRNSGIFIWDITGSTTGLNDGAWHHVALVQTDSDNTARIYVDGQLDGSETNTNPWFNVADDLYFGYVDGDSRHYTGYLDEVRLSKGVARWTSNFTPSTVPYAVSPSSPNLNTAGYDVDMSGDLILSGTGTLDAVASSAINIAGDWTNAGTFNAATNTLVTFDGTSAQDLIAGGDGFYNLTHSGTGDLRINDDLAVTGDLVNSAGKMDTNDTFNNITVTGDVTVSGGELEIDPIATLITGGTLTVSGGTLDAVSGVLDANGDVIISSGTLIAPTGNFNVADDFTIGASGTYTKGGLLIFDGTTIFTDGATQNVGDVFIASSVTLASNITLDSLAIQDGGNDSDAVLLLDLDSDFTDDSLGGSTHTVSPYGSAQIDATQKKFGAGSFISYGTPDSLTIPDSDDWDFGTGDFTIDFQIYRNGAQATCAVMSTLLVGNSGYGITMAAANTLIFRSTASGSWAADLTSSEVLPDQTWTHVAYVRSGNTLTVYQNGVSKGSVDVTGYTYNSPGAGMAISRYYVNLAGYYSMKGNLDEIRVSNVARWTTDFTSPILPYAASPSSPNLNTAGYDVDMSGDLTLQGTGVLDATTGSNIDIAGDWTNAGTFNAATNTLVTFDGTSAQDLIAGGDGFYNLTHSGTGDLRINDDLAVTGDLVNSAGTFDVNDQDISIVGTTGISGGSYNTGEGVNTFTDAVTVSGSSTVNIESDDTPSDISIGSTWTNTGGTIVYRGPDSTTTNIVAAIDLYNNLEIDSTNSTYSLQGALDVNGTFSLTNGTLDCNGQDQNYAGDFTLASGITYTKGGVVTFDGTTIFTDGTVGQNIGTLEIGGSLLLASDLLADDLTINDAGNDSNTLFLLNFDSDFTDSAVGAGSIHFPTDGGATIDTGVKRFGAGSGYFNSSELDNVTYPNSNDWTLGTNDFTIDFWANFDSVSETMQIYSQRQDDNNFTAIYYYPDTAPDELRFIVKRGGSHVYTFFCEFTASINTWDHVAFVRKGTSADDFDVYINGQAQAVTPYGSWDGDVTALAAQINMGAFTGYFEYMNGYLDEFRMSNVARWTSNFTPPTYAYKASDGTVNTAGYNIDLTNSLNIYGTLNASSGDGGISNIALEGDWANAEIFTPGNSTVTFDGTGAQNLIAGGDGFYNLTHSGAGTLNLTDTLTVSGDFTNSAGKSDTNGQNITVTGTTVISGGELEIDTGATLEVDGTLTVSGGVLDGLNGTINADGDVGISSGTLIAPSGNFTVAGNWSKTGGSFNNSSGSIIFDDDIDNVTVSFGGSTFRNVVINKDNATDTVTFNGANIYADLTVSKGELETQGAQICANTNYTLTIEADGTLIAPSSTLYIGGSYDNQGGTFIHSNGTVMFNGGSLDMTLNSGGTGVGKDFYNLTKSGSGVKLYLLADLHVLNNLDDDDGTLFTNDYTLDVDNDLISAYNLNLGSSEVYVGGSWIHTGNNVTMEADCVVTFDGDTEDVTIDTGGKSFTNLVINKTESDYTVTVQNDDLTVTGDLTIKEGKLVLQTDSTLGNDSSDVIDIQEGGTLTSITPGITVTFAAGSTTQVESNATAKFIFTGASGNEINT